MSVFLQLIFSDSPIGKLEDTSQVRSGIGSPIDIQCEVCAQPSPDAYEWKFNGEDLRGGIDGQGTDTITISEVAVDESDFGFYTCDVTNSIGSRMISIELVPYGQ